MVDCLEWSCQSTLNEVAMRTQHTVDLCAECDFPQRTCNAKALMLFDSHFTCGLIYARFQTFVFFPACVRAHVCVTVW